jgi:hypothetical protein
MKVPKELDTRTFLLYSALVIVWWACIWGIFEEFIHHVSNKNSLNKVLLYSLGIFIILGTIHHLPDTLNHF